MRPWFALETPHSCVKDVWVRRIYFEIRDAVLIVDVESFGPGFAAVSGHKHTALIVRAKGVSECADVDDVRVLRINGDSGNAFGIFETHVLPGLTAVGRFVNTIAERNAVSNIRFAGPYPNYLRITRRQCDVADRDCSLSLEDGSPFNSTVRCLP